MKKKVWIINHYATNSFFNEGGRHFWFAKNLNSRNYEGTIFCANTRHNRNDALKISGRLFEERSTNGIRYIFVRTTKYVSNDIRRVLNMISFFVNLILISSKCSDKYGRPDIILASSVHPLTLVAGIIISRKFKIPCICEVRDLWPESLVAYKIINKDSLLTSILYKFEKWIYRKADSIIMTWEGGKDYIQDQGWEKEIQLDKIAHISNGVDLESFDRNSVEHQILDEDLDNATLKNIIYTGSVRKVNNLGIILDVAKIIQNKGLHDIRFLIYGAGDEKEVLVKRCVEENIQNVIFKGRINKNQVPAVLKKAYANLLHNTSTSLDKYGQSQNKLFEYLAAGKCIIQTYMTNYNLCERYNCGYVVQKQEAELIADAIISAYHNPDQCEEYGRNAREAASNHDFTILTDKLIKIIEGHLSKKESIGV